MKLKAEQKNVKMIQSQIKEQRVNKKNIDIRVVPFFYFFNSIDLENRSQKEASEASQKDNNQPTTTTAATKK